MSEGAALERGFMPALCRFGQGLLSLPRGAVVALLLGWSYLMLWAMTLPSQPAEGINYFKSWVTDLGHAPLFGLWVLCMVPFLPRNGEWVVLGKRAWAVLLSMTLAFGVTSEWLQSSIPGRVAAWGDVVTDLVGAICVLWVVSYLGSPGASEAGTRSRLLRGVVACCAAALLATLSV
jgi:hypothetical protein